ncbi:MAG TPA: acyl carrier protein [Proteobacteria bacterium]|nr:acyl carrier protein [Pseudomonadota bacterium]
MTSEQIEAKVKELIAAKLGMDVDKVRNDAHFIKDLGADSLKVVELVMTFEDEFDLGEIPDEVVEGIQTVQDVIDYLVKRLT